MTDTVAPADAQDVAEAIRRAYEENTAIYPLGGGTSVAYGLMPIREGIGLQVGGLSQIVDYTPRDMTIVVDPGVRVADLANTLSGEKQILPVDAPQAESATIGGLIATDWSGPRRYGYGTLRDYVIGIGAVDGRGVPFKGGGRVVKNVAGYDFCKLLTGSLGTLGVITQLTLKVKPRQELSAAVMADCPSLAVAERALEAMVQVPSPPTAIDLQIGPAWQDDAAMTLVVRIEGTDLEVQSMHVVLEQLLADAAAERVRTLPANEADALLAQQVNFPQQPLGDDGAPLVVKISAVPSATTPLIAELLAVDPNCSLQVQAGSGMIYARFSQFDPADLGTILVGRLQPAVRRHEGALTVLASEFEGLTRQIVWGSQVDAGPLMQRVKDQFDPRNILNPGRFIFS